MSPQPARRRRRILIGVGIVVVLIAAAGTVFALTRPGDVSNPDVEFRAEPTDTPVPDATKPPKKGEKDPLDSFVWAHYGYSKDRRRYLPASQNLRPPYYRVWSVPGRVLLEFGPVLGGKSLYLLKNNGALYAIAKNSGRVRWKRKLGYLAASSPAYGDGVIYVTLLQRGRHTRAGRAIALRASDGKILWNRLLPSRSESSPLLDGDHVYFGSENGNVYSLRTADGSVRWKFKAKGAVKAALAMADGKLYFGDYSGRVYAIWADSGKLAWSKGTSGARFGLGSGQFYSTPAVAYGRVYLGNTDGNVYSYASDNGKLAWRKHTNGYVYASPAVAQVPGGAPTVYIGSYSGTFYALDARSGRVRWSYNAHGKISGASTVVGDIVYFSTINGKNTFGLGVRTGRRVFYIGRGAYNPVVSDGRTIFLNGYSSLYALRPLSAKGEVKAARRRTDGRRASRAACLRKAERYHTHKKTIRRSYYRCVRRHHAQRR
jgi:outer membrane protein assembly factor BamB